LTSATGTSAAAAMLRIEVPSKPSRAKQQFRCIENARPRFQRTLRWRAFALGGCCLGGGHENQLALFLTIVQH
jgi:hypothetical protein